MSFVLGIDIGTSFSAAAVARLDGSGQSAPQVLNLGVRGGAVPSVIFLGEDGQVLVGEAAERRGTTHPDRLVREFKRRVGDAVPIVVGDLSVAPEDIVATMARWVVDRAQEREGEPPAAIAIAHPASWGGYKRDLIRQALAGVGLSDVTLVSEPEAAAVHYASQERVDEGSTIAVYDLGGGTFDAAVLQKSNAETFRTLGRPEGLERLGGADFDDAVFRHVASCAADALAGLDITDPGMLMALARLRRECTEAKEALSTDSEASIPVLLPGGQSQIRLVRSEFEAMIDDGVQQTIAALKRAMQAADTDAEDLSAILLIGGSSRIPLVAQLLSAEFNRPIAIDADPKASISLGAAFSAAAMLAPAAAGAQTVPDSPAAPEEVTAGKAAAGETTGHSHGFGTDTGTGAPVASVKPAHPRTGARMTAVAATVATLTILTATAAQSPAEMNSLAAGAAGAQAPEEEGGAGTVPLDGAAGPQGSGAGGPAGMPVLDGSGGAPITDNWQAVDADADPVTGTAPVDGTAGAANNDGGTATTPKGSTSGTNAARPDSPSSTPKPTTKGTSPSAPGPAAEPSTTRQEPTSPAPQPESPATGPAPTTPAQPPATQPPTTAEPPVTPAPDAPQTPVPEQPVPEPPAPEQTVPAADPPAPAPPEPAPPEPAPPAPTATEPAADPVPPAPAPEAPSTAPVPAPEG